jgi:hypothetical protein
MDRMDLGNIMDLMYLRNIMDLGNIMDLRTCDFYRVFWTCGLIAGLSLSVTQLPLQAVMYSYCVS